MLKINVFGVQNISLFHRMHETSLQLIMRHKHNFYIQNVGSKVLHKIYVACEENLLNFIATYFDATVV